MDSKMILASFLFVVLISPVSVGALDNACAVGTVGNNPTNMCLPTGVPPCLGANFCYSSAAGRDIKPSECWCTTKQITDGGKCITYKSIHPTPGYAFIIDCDDNGCGNTVEKCCVANIVRDANGVVNKAATTCKCAMARRRLEKDRRLDADLLDLSQCPVDPTTMGDPHFKLWSGEWFDFHSECDLVLIEAEKLGLRVHIRTKARNGYSYIESAALQLGNDILEVGSFGGYFFNGIQNGQFPQTMGEFAAVTRQQLNEKSHFFLVTLENNNEHSEAIEIKTFKDMVSVTVRNGSGDHFGTSRGLLGGFFGGQKLARDGSTVLDDPDAFGNEWQVLETEPHLFQAIRAPQHPQACIPPKQDASANRRRLGDSAVSREAAELACSHFEDARYKDMCVFDVLAFNDIELAEAGVY